MADFSVTQDTVDVLPSLHKEIDLAAGECLTDDADVAAWVALTIASGKVARVCVTIDMCHYDNA